ncbi:MAG: response regulator [Gemmatimonadaceae bacterium]|nr:response regulator [Gemmatimonadaceae bacterium]
MADFPLPPVRMPAPDPLGSSILVAEDSLEQRDLYVALLTSAGYRVLVAGDGAEAVQVAQRERPGLILMDVTMPGTSGWNAVRVLKADSETRAIPIIIITGLSGSWDRDASLAAGCDEYLAKPVAPARLLEEVRKFLPR